MPGNFFDIPVQKPAWAIRPECRHPEHKAPDGLHIPQGKGYRHVCPACGATDIVIPQQYEMLSGIEGLAKTGPGTSATEGATHD